MEQLQRLWAETSLMHGSAGQWFMMIVGLGFMYLAIAKKFEPLLLLPIGFGAILANIPNAGLAEPGGFLESVYTVGISTGIFPLLIFMGVGALTDFGALIANPRTLLLGAAAQFGIFATLLGAMSLNFIPGLNFSLQDASAIAIIGGADGPTAIFLAARLAPELLGAIAIAAYSYMALVPIIQPPIMRLLTTEKERSIPMQQLRTVSAKEKLCFPFMILLITILFIPAAAPLIGLFCLGNILRECGVVARLLQSAQNDILNGVTLLLGLGVGSRLSAERFLQLETLAILALGACAFAIGTASGILMGKMMCYTSRGKINPLIGAAGVSAVPMAARVVNKVGLEANPHNYLLMHAMGPNVAGVLGSAIAAGILLALVG